MNTLNAINKTLHDLGFSKGLEFSSSSVFITLDTGVAGIRNGDLSEKYRDRLEKIPGVESDEGQSDGYFFKVDLETFTPASEKKLRKLVADFAKRDEALSRKTEVERSKLARRINEMWR